MMNGIDCLLFSGNNNTLKPRRIALVTNNASMTSSGMYARIAILQAGFQLVKIFTPEHSITTQGIDGEFQANNIDSITGLPIISLYGDSLKPKQEDLEDIDLVLFDIPDIGCRFYTYLWTLTYVMESCAENQKPLIVLDRPNTTGINLDLAEGPFLDEITCSSFIGRWSVPIRHSCTIGELALYFKNTRITNLDLEIIKVQDYSRPADNFRNFSHWIPPSPAIKSQNAALLYPGIGLLEGINISEGRGTSDPFTVCGAPFIDNDNLIYNWELDQDACIISAHAYTPESGIYVNQKCNGLYFKIKNPNTFKSVSFGLHLLTKLIVLYPDQVQERDYPTLANPTGKNHLNRLLGVHNSFNKIMSGSFPTTVVKDEWKSRMENHLLY